MRRFYSPKENFSNGVAVLDLDETRHLRDVLRLHAGEEVRVFDGEASEYLCRIRSIEKKKTVLDVLRPITPEAPARKILIPSLAESGEMALKRDM